MKVKNVEIKKGDIVGRISYGKDILFYVDRIIKAKGSDKAYAILKGVKYRIEADAPLDDLEKIEREQIETEKRGIETKIRKRLSMASKEIFTKDRNINSNKTNAIILHLDGDKRYTQKSEKYYRKLGLNAIVKNIPENRQPQMIGNLVKKYDPDIVVITGHDGMIRNGTNYNDIYNYRNSRYFIKSVIEAKKASRSGKDMVIFAGACQSFFEAIMDAGANFASSPARVLIDFMDPLIVAEKIAITDKSRIVTVKDISEELR